MRFFLTIVASFLGVMAALIFIFFLFVTILAMQDPTPSVSNQTVLIIDLEGMLPEAESADPIQELISGRVVTLRQVIGALEKAAVDDRIVGVWLKPSGVQASWATLAELHSALEAYRASGKPLIASSGDNGYSESSYFLATTADTLYSPPEAMFEMNGFYISAPFFGDMFARLGIDPIVVRAGDYKAAAENFTERQFSPENREQYAELLYSFDDLFRSAVVDARPVSREVIDQVIADGGLYAASDAADLGLIDELRYEHEVEDLWRHHTDQAGDASLRTVSLRNYIRVPEREAGIRPGDRNNRIALIYATGIIMPGTSGAEGMTGDILGSQTFVDNIQEAVRNDRTRAIVIRIDSPGGSATASDAMWAAVRDASQHVPVIVSMASVAASGGYYMAASADLIVAEHATITGSIGVISLIFDATTFLDDSMGITIDTIQTGPAAGAFAMFDPVMDIEIEVMQQMTDRVYDTFVDRVAVGRGLDPETVRELGGGRVYTGQRAMELGLVDEIGDLRHAIRLAAERAELADDEYRLLVLPHRRPLIERLSEMFSTETAMQWWAHRSMSSEEQVIRRQVQILQDAVRMHGTVQMRMLQVPEVR